MKVSPVVQPVQPNHNQTNFLSPGYQDMAFSGGAYFNSRFPKEGIRRLSDEKIYYVPREPFQKF